MTHPEAGAATMTPLEVLEAAFPWPGRTIERSDFAAQTVAANHDVWVSRAKRMYLNRIALLEKLERI
jgi:hypothetical protein